MRLRDGSWISAGLLALGVFGGMAETAFGYQEPKASKEAEAPAKASPETPAEKKDAAPEAPSAPPPASAPLPKAAADVDETENEGPKNALDPKARRTRTDGKAADPVDKRRKSTKSDRVVTRQEYLDMPGAPRTPLANFRVSRPMKFERPPKASEDRFESMRKGQSPIDPQVIDAWAKFHTYSMADRAEERNLSQVVTNILQRVQNARNARNELNHQFVVAYKKAVIKYAQDLLDNSLLVQINTLFLLGRLNESRPDIRDVRGDVKEVVPVLVSVLADPKREDAVHFLAMKGLEDAKRRGLMDVEPERNAVVAMLKILERRDVQPLLREQIVMTLGVLARAYTGFVPERAEVATVLANIALNSKNDFRLRVEAAVALGSLQTGPRDVRAWNVELVGVVVGQILKEVAEKQATAQMPEDIARWNIYRLGRALRHQLVVTEDPQFSEFFNSVVMPILQDTIEKRQVDLAALTAWLAARQPPKLLKLAPDAPEIAFPVAKGADTKPQDGSAK